jgi:hypothetical protein
MKRFLILSILIVFVTVSSVGANQVGWTRHEWIKSQGEFEKDRKGCIESIDENLTPEAFGRALEECMGKKGYQYQISEKPEEPPPSPGMILLYIAGVIVLVPLAVALIGLSALAGSPLLF